MTKFFVILFLCIAGTSAYPDLPQVNAVEVTLEISVSSLESLFNSAKGFVDLVFVSFAELKEFFIRFLKSSDPLNIVTTEWQSILKQQAGLIACLTFGVLFIIMVIFGGAIMCLCRCCCNKCGGKLQQSKKRSRSKWRCGLTLALLGCSILILSPGVIVLLTNQWINTVVHDLPEKTNETVQNVINFLDIIPTQIKLFISEFIKLTDDVVGRIKEMPKVVGEKVQIKIATLQDPFKKNFAQYLLDVPKLQSSLKVYEMERNTYTSWQENHENALNDFKTNSSVELNNLGCAGNPNCEEVMTIITNLNNQSIVLEDRSQSVVTLRNYDQTCLNVLRLILPINDNNVINFTNDALDDDTITDAESNAVNTFNPIQVQLNNSLDIEETFSSIRKKLVEYQDQIDQVFKIYSDNYDIYRWYAGLGLGIFIILLPSLYIFGIFFGQFCSSSFPSPTKRGVLSNLGGILLMSSVGLFFLLSWILMIVVTITFIFGGMVERYGCETAQSPYELLKFMDENILNNLNLSDVDLLETPKFESYSIITSCAQNKGILEALGITNLFNTSEIEKELKDASFNINITYPSNNLSITGVLHCLELLNTTLPLDPIVNSSNIDVSTFSEAIKKIENVSMDPKFDNAVSTIINNLSALQTDALNGKTKIETVNDEIRLANKELSSIKELLIVLPTLLNEANEQVILQTPKIIDQAVNGFSDTLTSNMTGYINWFIYQTSNNFAKCGPIYTAYDGALNIVCGYFIATMNGFWFALGWSLFFMIPAFIFALKLAKFYRRMEKTDPDPPEPTSIKIHPIQNMNNSQIKKRVLPSKIDESKLKRYIPKRPNNKVRPADF